MAQLKLLSTVLSLSIIRLATANHHHHHDNDWEYPDITTPPSDQAPLSPHSDINGIPYSTREYWMHQTTLFISSSSNPCPRVPFVTVIVNHTDTTSQHGSQGRPICIDINHTVQNGNPALHGETQAMITCTSVLGDPTNPHHLSPDEILASWKDFSLYTNGEPCSMCATAIRWAGFKETVYGTSIPTLTKLGWKQSDIRTKEVFDRTDVYGEKTMLMGPVLEDETNPFFAWQFKGGACPTGCARDDREGGLCVPSSQGNGEKVEL